MKLDLIAKNCIWLDIKQMGAIRFAFRRLDKYQQDIYVLDSLFDPWSSNANEYLSITILSGALSICSLRKFGKMS